MIRKQAGTETLKTLDSSSIMKLRYYILEDEIMVDGKSLIEYGVEIEKLENQGIEKSQIASITTDQSRIDFIIKTLKKNSVTPVHLHDVIVDMLWG